MSDSFDEDVQLVNDSDDVVLIESMDGVEQPKGRTSTHSLQNQPSKGCLISLLPEPGALYYIKYRVAGGTSAIATTRPETLFGDTTTAVNPEVVGGGEFSPGKLRTMLEVEGVEISNLLNLKQLKLGKKVAAMEKEIASIRVEKEVAAMEKEVAACI
ncbi:hypothetical protein OROMI_008275 [Orobanche minor]